MEASAGEGRIPVPEVQVLFERLDKKVVEGRNGKAGEAFAGELGI